MSATFLILTIVFIVISAAMVLIILVQRPQGGGLAGAFGGAGGGSTDTVFGGRVGDALTAMTVGAFVLYLLLSIGLNLLDPRPVVATAATQPSVTGTTPTGETVPITVTPSAGPDGSQPISGSIQQIPAPSFLPPPATDAPPPTSTPPATPPSTPPGDQVPVNPEPTQPEPTQP